MEDTKEKCEKDFGGVDAALLITPGLNFFFFLFSVFFFSV